MTRDINHKFLNLLFIGMLVLMSVGVSRQALAQSFLAGPWVIYGGYTNVNIIIVTSQDVDDDFNSRRIHFDYPDGCNEPNWGYTHDDPSWGRVWKVWANNLSPDCEYNYEFKIWVRDMDGTDYWDTVSGVFKTGPGWGQIPDTAEFFAFGDQKYTGDHKVTTAITDVADTIRTGGGATTGLPLVHTGDFAYYGGNNHWNWLSLLDIGTVQKLFTHTLVLPTHGNHDIQISDDYSEGDATNYTRFFPFWPEWKISDPRQLYYHKVYRPFHFYSLASEPMDINLYCSDNNRNYRPLSEGGTGQYEWLEQQFSENQGSETPWKIVFTHAPIYSPEDCNSKHDAVTYLVPLLEKYGVDIFVAGHEHYYARKIVNGIPYLILGGGGAGKSLGDDSPCQTDPQSCNGFDFVANKHHYADIITHGDVMTVKVRDENNAPVETFTVDRTPEADFEIDPESGVAVGGTVKFIDTSSGHRYEYEWDFGDGSSPETGSGRDASTEHIYSMEGIYTVTLTITSAYQSDAKTCTGCVEIGPKADFDASPLEGDAPLTVSFQDKSEGAASSWLWDFGDGETSTEKNPMHTYNEHGRHSVSLTVSNNGLSNRKVVNDFVGVWPYASFQYKMSRVCVESFGGTCYKYSFPSYFSNLSEGDYLTYEWDFGDGQTSNEEIPSHTYSNSGSRAKLTVTDSEGRTDYMTKYIEIGTGMPSPPEPVEIDIMLKSPIIITPHGRIVPRIIRVAILRIDNRPASDLKLDTITFGRTGNEESLKGCNKRKRDINNDGYMDLICSFNANKAGFQYGDYEGILRGMTRDGHLLEGRNMIRVVYRIAR